MENKQRLSGIEYVHSRFFIREFDNCLLTREGSKLNLGKREFEALKTCVINTGRIIDFGDFNGINDWRQPRVARESSSLLGLLTNLKKKIIGVGLYDENFPQGYLLSIPSRGHVLVNPDVNEQVKLFKPYAVQVSRSQK